MAQQNVEGEGWKRAKTAVFVFDPSALILFLLFAALYFATASGITSSNDGSHYALTRALLSERSFALGPFDDYAEGNDVAIYNGRLYSDRPPGTAVTATLFYLLGEALPGPLAPLPSRHDDDNPALLYVLLLPAWAGAGTLALLYLLLRRQGVAAPAAWLACLMLGLSTAHWKYSSVLFSHALSTFLVTSCVYLALGLARAPVVSWWRYALLGLLLGWSVVVEYANALLVGLIGGYVLLWGIRPFTPKRLAITLLPFTLAGLLPAAFLAYYNQTNFGSPFTFSYAYALNYPWAGEFASTFSTPLLAGLKAMLFFGESGGWCGGSCYNQGVFLLSPVLLLALPGLYWYARRQGREMALTTAVFLTYLLLFATHHTAHGFTADGRYLVPFYALLVIPLAYTLEWVGQRPYSVGSVLLQTAVFALFFLSVRDVLLHIGFSYNYALDLAQLNPMVAHPDNWRYLFHTLLPNWRNLPLLFLAELLVLLPLILLHIGWRKRRLKSVA